MRFSRRHCVSHRRSEVWQLHLAIGLQEEENHLFHPLPSDPVHCRRVCAALQTIPLHTVRQPGVWDGVGLIVHYDQAVILFEKEIDEPMERSVPHRRRHGYLTP